MRLDTIYIPIAEDLQRVESELKERLRSVARDNRLVSLGDSVLNRAIEHLLLAHGAPWIGGAREALHDFVCE